MFTFRKIALFLIANTMGFFSIAICFSIAVLGKFIDLSHPDFDVEAFRTNFMVGTLTIWIICAFFSLAWFFLKGKIRFVFLWAPAIVPIVYGLSVLYGAPL